MIVSIMHEKSWEERVLEKFMQWWKGIVHPRREVSRGVDINRWLASEQASARRLQPVPTPRSAPTPVYDQVPVDMSQYDFPGRKRS